MLCQITEIWDKLLWQLAECCDKRASVSGTCARSYGQRVAVKAVDLKVKMGRIAPIVIAKIMARHTKPLLAN